MWCSDRCRKTQYSRPCVDCGTLLNGSDGRGPNASQRCPTCAIRHAKETGLRKVWTRDRLLAAIQAWAECYGGPPAICDWDPTRARENLHDTAREARYFAGDWPHAHTVIREFGSWSAGLEAAGFTARAAHGGSEYSATARRQRAA